jgi:hypothetical protein
MAYELVCGRTDHMLPHVPSAEMVKNHPWHVYREGQLCYTATHAECVRWLNKMTKAQTQSRSEP